MVDAIARLAVTPPLQVGPLQVDVFSLNGHPVHGDEALAADLQLRMRDRGVVATLRPYRGQDPLATVREIGRCDAFISARLHGAIVAYLCGVPFAIVDYHPKCRDFADDIGLPPELRITSKQHGVEAFAAAVTTMLNDADASPRVSPHLYAQQAQKIFQYAPWSTSSPPHEP
jgi:polysaccharide pyruvyl transferase WcaK-like protein